MTYTAYLPAPPLNRYIDDLYFCDGVAPYSHVKVLPMPSLHLMVNLGDSFHVHQPDHTARFATCTQSWCVGLWSNYHTVAWPKTVKFYGVHFKAEGVYPFLRIPLSELHNQIVSLDVLWGRFAAELRERLYAAPSVQAGFALFERLLLDRLQETPYGLDVVRQAVSEIERHDGDLSIKTLSDHIGISQNHLGNQFKRMVGVPPKELARVYRFARVLRSVNPVNAVDWVLLAHECGYHDQSHLYKDFVAFTGHNPTNYLRLRQLQGEHPEQAQNLGQLPTD